MTEREQLIERMAQIAVLKQQLADCEKKCRGLHTEADGFARELADARENFADAFQALKTESSKHAETRAALEAERAANANAEQVSDDLAAVREVVRERMVRCEPQDWKIQGESDSRTLRKVEQLLFPTAHLSGAYFARLQPKGNPSHDGSPSAGSATRTDPDSDPDPASRASSDGADD